MEDAALNRARSGTQSGEIGVFTPSQLIQASRQSERRFGSNGLRELAEQGQQVLPSTVPNSGTADRALAATFLGGGVGATGLGFGESGPNYDSTNPTALASAIAVLTALGTRRGQQALNRAAFDRPERFGQVGQAIRRRSGLFGSGAVPLALEVNR